MVKIVEDRSETAFEDISVESDGEKVRLKIEIQRVFCFHGRGCVLAKIRRKYDLLNGFVGEFLLDEATVR